MAKEMAVRPVAVAPNLKDDHGPIREAFEVYAARARSVDPVEGVYAVVEEPFTRVVVIANKISLEERSRLYKIQLAVRDLYPEIEWDFQVLDFMGFDPYIPSGENVLHSLRKA